LPFVIISTISVITTLEAKSETSFLCLSITSKLLRIYYEAPSLTNQKKLMKLYTEQSFHITLHVLPGTTKNENMLGLGEYPSLKTDP